MIRLTRPVHAMLAIGIVVLSGLVSLTLSPSSVSAATCGGVETSIISGDICEGADVESTDSADNPIVSVFTFVVQVLTGAVGVAAVGALVYAGILYAAAGGDSGQVQKAKTMIKDTVIGIVCYGGMVVLLNFVIPGGVFGQGGVVGGGTSGGGSSSDDEQIAEIETGTDGTERLSVVLATWNVLKYDNARSNMYAGIREIFSQGAGVIGLQEVDDPSFNTNSLDGLKSNTIGVYFPKGTTPIVWNKEKYTLKDSGYIRPISDRGKYFPYVRLQHKTTKNEIYVMNVHMEPGVNNQPQGCQSVACAAYKKQMVAVKEELNKLKKSDIPVFILGDFNVNYRYDYKCKITWQPCYSLDTISMKSNFKALKLQGIASKSSTVGSASTLIDYVFYWTKSPVATTMRSERILGANVSCKTSSKTDIDGDKIKHCWHASDHKPLLVTVSVETPKK